MDFCIFPGILLCQSPFWTFLKMSIFHFRKKLLAIFFRNPEIYILKGLKELSLFSYFLIIFARMPVGHLYAIHINL